MMFKKARNRILLINMIMVSTVVIAAFLVIFTGTFTRVKNENEQKLARAAYSGLSITAAPMIQKSAVFEGDLEAGYAMPMSVSGYTTRISPDSGLSFSLLVDARGDLVGVNSMVDIQSSEYLPAVAEALRVPSSGETLLFGGRTWQYAVTPVFVTLAGSDGESEYFESSIAEYTDIRFLDVTDSIQTLRSLAIMLLTLTVVILAAFFLISLLFANRAIRPMREAWEKQQRFVADASHELKTPLTVIHANCGVLYTGREETVEQQIKWVDNITRAANRMTGLIGSLLSLAKMEDTHFEPQIHLFNLSEAVTETVSEMETPAYAKGLSVIKSIEPELHIESDRAHIQQVLSILLDNAIKYTAGGGEVSVTLKKEKRHIHCLVRNSGGDIPAEDLSRLYDRFYRRDPARSFENGGYGLGLAIAKAAAARISGSISVHSETGKYTEFQFTLNEKH